MKDEKLSPIQLYTMIVLFELGSAIIVGIGLEAKQDVWVVIAIGTSAGILLFTLYDFILKVNPELTYIGSIKKTFGKIGGTLIGVIYVTYFLYIASRVLRDLGEIIVTTILDGTPTIAVNILLVISVLIACYLSVEVIGRMTEVYFPYIVLFGGLLLSFIYIGGLPELKNLQPFLKNGLQPIMDATFPKVITFPFGELVVFFMFIPYLNKPELAKRTGYIAIALVGMVLILVNMTIVAVLGGDQATKSVTPLIDALAKVNIGNFIQRLDPLALIILIICGYFKIAILFYASLIGLDEITGGKLKKRLILPMGLLLITLSSLIASNWVQHLIIGLEWVPYYLHIPLEIIFPAFFALFLLAKKKWIQSYAR